VNEKPLVPDAPTMIASTTGSLTSASVRHVTTKLAPSPPRWSETLIRMKADAIGPRP
jgi:hypothetical protein